MGHGLCEERLEKEILLTSHIHVRLPKKEIYTLSEIVCYFGCWRARISRLQPNTPKNWHNNNNYNYVTRCMIIVK